MALTPEQIAALYAKRRTKGLYGELLVEFMASGDTGVSVREEWSTDFAWDPTKPEGERGKIATTLKQGFENAKKVKEAPVGSENIDVIVDGDDVYLINKNLTEGGVEDTAPDNGEVAVEVVEPVVEAYVEPVVQ